MSQSVTLTMPDHQSVK